MLIFILEHANDIPKPAFIELTSAPSNVTDDCTEIGYNSFMKINSITPLDTNLSNTEEYEMSYMNIEGKIIVVRLVK